MIDNKRILIKDIKPKKSDFEILNDLRYSSLPLVIWGAAKSGMILFKRLKRYNINVSAVFVDTPFAITEINGYSINSFEEICAKHIKFNILVAHGYPKLKEKYSAHPQVNEVYSLFDMNDFEMNISSEFFSENENSFYELFNNLSDALSRESFSYYLTSRLNNNWDYIEKYVDDSGNIPAFMNLTKNEIVIDCGAYTGDTLLSYIDKIGEFEEYYAWEPDNENYNKLRENSEYLNLNIKILKLGAWKNKDTLYFHENGDQSYITNDQISGDATEIQVDSIDNICQNKATYIKMDIEGAEHEALQGAYNTIMLNKPKLAISIYHRKIDLIRIPGLIKSINSDYQFYFRLHHKLGVDAVLYAI